MITAQQATAIRRNRSVFLCDVSYKMHPSKEVYVCVCVCVDKRQHCGTWLESKENTCLLSLWCRSPGATHEAFTTVAVPLRCILLFSVQKTISHHWGGILAYFSLQNCFNSATVEDFSFWSAKNISIRLNSGLWFSQFNLKFNLFWAIQRWTC